MLPDTVRVLGLDADAETPSVFPGRSSVGPLSLPWVPLPLLTACAKQLLITIFTFYLFS